MGLHPPKPRIALSIGVIGHSLNRLPEHGRLGVAARIREVLSQLSGAAQMALEEHKSSFADATPALTLISGLADGAEVSIPPAYEILPGSRGQQPRHWPRHSDAIARDG
jgi:hypothetical protein